MVAVDDGTDKDDGAAVESGVGVTDVVVIAVGAVVGAVVGVLVGTGTVVAVVSPRDVVNASLSS